MTAASDWLDQARRLIDVVVAGPAAPAAEPSAAGTGHGAGCTRCPLCQAAAIVRGERPEVTAALADVLTATATALRTFAEGASPADTATGTDDEPQAEPPPAVQRIEIA
jgi:hypothetical protein